MTIETTINLQAGAAERIEEAAEKMRKKKSKIIILLMERAITEWPELMTSFERLRYQERDPERKWTRMHIWLREDEYEYALDMRKLFKMSFSSIIAYAIEKFLDGLIRDLLYPEKADGDDNYRIKNYILVKDTVDEVFAWRIYWGVPINLEAILPTETE